MGLPSFLENLDPAIYQSDNYVVLDTETDTTGGHYGVATKQQNGLLLACWRIGLTRGLVKAFWGDEFSQHLLLADIAAADFIVAHNAKYELGWLLRCGADLRKILPFCTQLAEYVLYGNLASGDEVMPPRSLSLDACCRRRGMQAKDPVVDIMIKQGVNPRDIPRAWLEARCRQDVLTTEQLFLSQRAALARTGRLPVQYTRCLLTPVLADIEFNGMHLDKARVDAAYEEYKARMTELSARMEALTGGINWRSSKQAAAFIYDKLAFAELTRKDGTPRRTASGARMTDQKTLAALKAETDEQQAFLELRKELGKTAAALSKNLEFFVGTVREGTGRFEAEFQQTKTATHRLSSTGVPVKFEMFPDAKSVQLQNSPRAFKKLYSARSDGWKMAEADGAQLEFRVAVQLGYPQPDLQGLQDIRTGHDVHVFTASSLNAITSDKVTPAQRQDAKSHTFKPLYGGQKGTKAQERYYKAFRERYPQINLAQRRWLTDVLNTKRLVTPWGLRYYWPYAKTSKSGYVNVTSAVFNYPVQALATAEIIPIAVVYFWHRMAEYETGMMLVNTVHDSLVAEIEPGMEETFKGLALQSFTRDVYQYLDKVYGMPFKVPLGCGIKIGDFWGEAEEQSFNVYPDGRVEKAK